ncbi:MAG: hypothetical protein ACTIAM_04890 [Pseudolactococcus laudensis]|uniref:hypothetical protein n=1 Tax=Pseudolactococcus laudensis TaxID=1494461 RepID=UPI003F9CABE0
MKIYKTIITLIIGVLLGILLTWGIGRLQKTDAVIPNATYTAENSKTWKSVDVKNDVFTLTTSTDNKIAYKYFDLGSDRVLLSSPTNDRINQFKVIKNGDKYEFYRITNGVTSKKANVILTSK